MALTRTEIFIFAWRPPHILKRCEAHTLKWYLDNLRSKMKFFQSETIIILIIAMLTTELSAQDNLKTIKVIDNLTKKPVKDALIYFNDSISSKTNYLGYSQINVSTGDTISISSIDYSEKFIIVPTEQKFQIGIEKNNDKLGFTGGMRAFYKQLADNLTYPSKARSKKIQSDIFVEFKIDSVGHSRVTQVHNDVNGVFEKEIKRVFKSIKGAWDIEYSDRTFLLPIKFRILPLTPPNDIEFESITIDRKLTAVVLTISGGFRTVTESRQSHRINRWNAPLALLRPLFVLHPKLPKAIASLAKRNLWFSCLKFPTWDHWQLIDKEVIIPHTTLMSCADG
jgi:hypothetical protein